MFSSLGLFAKVPCPISPSCELPGCLFSHSLGYSGPPIAASEDVVGHRPKRRRLSDDLSQQEQPKKVRSSNRIPKKVITDPPTPPSESDEITRTEVPSTTKPAPPTTVRPISPPAPRRATNARPEPKPAASHPQSTKPAQRTETLNPRMVDKPPATHAARMVYIRKYHEFLQRLNKLVGDSTDPLVKCYHLEESELIKLVLDEEENIARKNFSMYANLIKQRVAAASKMTIEQWKAARVSSITKDKKVGLHGDGSQPHDVSTGLSRAKEMQVLSTLVADQSGLAKYGYVTSPPTDRDIVDTRAAVALCRGYEQCDRCSSRFQVFTERQEDGTFASGGSCTYHHGRAIYQGREKGQDNVANEKRYSCCNSVVGDSAGCTTSDSHVFKFSDRKRLASVLQFKRTPANPKALSGRAVAFDCEMGYTVYGMELIRLTATSWPTGDELIDVLVKPLGAVLDLNSRFSGVTGEQFANAVPHDARAVSETKLSGIPPIVASPSDARQLLFDLISPDTILIGHALENDLNATRIVHPKIVDTVLLYPARGGLPSRMALRVLTKQRLNRNIQTAGSAGHDSKEDANAAGDLVKLAIGKGWRKMEREGYKFVGDKLVAPAGNRGFGSLADTLREEVQVMKAAENSKAKDEEDPLDFWKD